jgi:arylformamidase
MTRALIDISPTLSPRLKVWPGDTAVSREVLMELSRGASVTLSTLRTTVHAGAHADAPSHYVRDGRTIEQQPLDLYVGPCQVVHVDVMAGDAVLPAMIDVAITAPRVLIATGTFPEVEKWRSDFASLSAELVDWLRERGVRLVGVDTPSVDQFASRDLPVHNSFAKHDMAILEGLVLRDVAAGEYELIALPLKLEGFDASPIRAVLRRKD